MSNVNAPNGFRPTRHLKGGVIRTNDYQIASGTASAILQGDPVHLADTGLLEKAAGGDVNLAGVFAGVRWTDPDGTPRFSNQWPAAQATKGAAPAMATVYDDPDIAFEVQCKTGTAFAQTNVGNNADFDAGTGNTATGMSGASLDISAAAAATANFRILGLIDRPGNAVGDSARIEVRFNEHLAINAAGI